MIKTVYAAALLVLCSVVMTQERHESQIPYKLEYVNSPDLPNGIAFYMELLNIDYFYTRFGPADAAALISQKLGLSNADSHNFVSQALTTLYMINTEVADQLTQHACHFVGPTVSKADKYDALQQTYDIHTAIYNHHYEQVKAILNADAGELLQEWMDEQKLKTGHHEIDFEKADQLTGKDSIVTLEMMCKNAD